MKPFVFEFVNQESINALATKTNREKAEVISDALAVYKHLVERIGDDKLRIYLGKDKDNITELEITTLEKLR